MTRPTCGAKAVSPLARRTPTWRAPSRRYPAVSHHDLADWPEGLANAATKTRLSSPRIPETMTCFFMQECSKVKAMERGVFVV